MPVPVPTLTVDVCAGLTGTNRRSLSWLVVLVSGLDKARASSKSRCLILTRRRCDALQYAGPGRQAQAARKLRVRAYGRVASGQDRRLVPNCDDSSRSHCRRHHRCGSSRKRVYRNMEHRALAVYQGAKLPIPVAIGGCFVRHLS